ncbi:unnamed protein product [Boreogadus saida]
MPKENTQNTLPAIIRHPPSPLLLPARAGWTGDPETQAGDCTGTGPDTRYCRARPEIQRPRLDRGPGWRPYMDRPLPTPLWRDPGRTEDPKTQAGDQTGTWRLRRRPYRDREAERRRPYRTAHDTSYRRADPGRGPDRDREAERRRPDRSFQTVLVPKAKKV